MIEGQKVVVLSCDLEGNNGWILADSVNPTGEHGYVPTTYLKVVDSFNEDLEKFIEQSQFSVRLGAGEANKLTEPLNHLPAVGQRQVGPSMRQQLSDVSTLTTKTDATTALVITHADLPRDDGVEELSEGPLPEAPAPCIAPSPHCSLPELWSQSTIAKSDSTKRTSQLLDDALRAVIGNDDFEDAGCMSRRRSNVDMAAIVGHILRAKRVARDRLPIFVLFRDENGNVVRLCFRARAERLKNGVSSKAKHQIIKKFFQKRPDLRHNEFSRYCAHLDTPLCRREAAERDHRQGTIILEVIDESHDHKVLLAHKSEAVMAPLSSTS